MGKAALGTAGGELGAGGGAKAAGGGVSGFFALIGDGAVLLKGEGAAFLLPLAFVVGLPEPEDLPLIIMITATIAIIATIPITIAAIGTPPVAGAAGSAV